MSPSTPNQADPTKNEPLSPSFQINLETSEDGMEAIVHVPLNLVGHLQIEEIVTILNSSQIKYGYNQLNVEREVEKFNRLQPGPGQHNFLVASGMLPGLSVDGEIELLVEENTKIQFDNQGRADFRNIDKFKNVEKGTVLARRTPPSYGQPGHSIYGQQILPKKPKDPYLVCGDNVVFSEQTNEYTAQVKGIFIREENKISVNSVLEIDGDAGMASGNLVYDGNIHVKGNVERGALLSCTGDLYVNGFIESNLIRVGKSLTVKKGINARDDEQIQVKKSLKCMYIDNTSIVVMANATVYRSINASKIIVHGDLNMSHDRSAIIGGSLSVFGSINVEQIGNPSGISTKITIGTHDESHRYYKIHLQQYNALKKEYEPLAEEIKRYKEMLARKLEMSTIKKQQIRDKYTLYKEKTAELQVLRHQMEEFQKASHNPMPVKITVRKNLHAMVEINYFNYKKTITNPLPGTVITFDPKNKLPKFSAYIPDEA